MHPRKHLENTCSGGLNLVLSEAQNFYPKAGSGKSAIREILLAMHAMVVNTERG